VRKLVSIGERGSFQRLPIRDMERQRTHLATSFFTHARNSFLTGEGLSNHPSL
jgi:hypothetical protein